MSTVASPSVAVSTNAYDETPYPSMAFPQTHPRRLAALARLFDLAAADPAKARVLELGCADGANLLPMAEDFPEATFVGIDTSKVEIAAGQKAISAAGLKNVELRLQDIADFPLSEGKYDYIIAHGVYSWVPAEIREKILTICATCLAESGVAYISYNALPGWNMRRSLRDMMLYHVQNFSDSKTKVQQARALLAFLAESVSTENTAYGMLLKSELAKISGYADSFLLHDLLGQENTPFYFHEFVTQISRNGLTYLSEASVADMLTANFPEQVRETLNKLNNQIVAQEQYMDFLRNRSFRQTLLCRANAGLGRNIAADKLKGFAFRSLLREATGPIELVPGVVVSFIAQGGGQISSSDAFVKALLWVLTETKGVAAISYQDLLAGARARSRAFLGEIPPDRDQMDEAALLNNLLNLLVKGVIELYVEPVRVRMDVPKEPALSPLARYQALNARLITNHIHQPVPADLISRHIMAVCDGTRTSDQIVEVLIDRVKEGALQVNEGAVALTEPGALRTLFRPRVEAALRALANSGFLA